MTQISQIKIGKHRVGIVGLEGALKKIADKFQERCDDRVSEELYKVLVKKNYIPETVSELYKTAFVKEYKKHVGISVGDPDSDDLEIKVLGGGCNICNSLENTVMEILSELNLPADLEHIMQKEKIREYGVLDGPALVINKKVVINGTIPPANEIRSLFGKYAALPQKKEPSKTQVLMKNIPFSEPRDLAGIVDYKEGQIVSKTFVQNRSVSMTVFAFDKGEGISTHTATGDAMLQVLDGKALVTVADQKMHVGAGQVVVMPADIPHSVEAQERFKMVLTIVKK